MLRLNILYTKMEYHNSRELEGRELKEGDSVIFNIEGRELRYRATDSYLSIVIGEGNDEILNYLGINKKYDYCSKIAGYPIANGTFPEVKTNDMVTLTKITIDLFKKCEEINGVSFKFKPKYNMKWRIR